MEEEIWKDIIGYEGKYQVSNKGNVKSLNYNKTKRSKILRPSKDKGGYYRVALCKNGKAKPVYIHFLVATAFNKKYESTETLIVNHIDETRTNNNSDNLEWCTYSQNINHGTCKDRMSKNSSIPVIQVDFNLNLIDIFKSAKDASICGDYIKTSISSCCLGKYKEHRGYRWYFLNSNQARSIIYYNKENNKITEENYEKLKKYNYEFNFKMDLYVIDRFEYIKKVEAKIKEINVNIKKEQDESYKYVLIGERKAYENILYTIDNLENLSEKKFKRV